MCLNSLFSCWFVTWCFYAKIYLRESNKLSLGLWSVTICVSFIVAWMSKACELLWVWVVVEAYFSRFLPCLDLLSFYWFWTILRARGSVSCVYKSEESKWSWSEKNTDKNTWVGVKEKILSISCPYAYEGSHTRMAIQRHQPAYAYHQREGENHASDHMHMGWSIHIWD